MAKISALLIVALLPAAAAAQSVSSSRDSGGSSSSVISSEQLRQPEVEGLSAWEIIERVRPRWLQSRGTLSFATPQEQVAIDSGYAAPRFPLAKVVVDGLEFGELIELRSLPVVEIEELRYLNSRDATTRFGIGYEGGAVFVVTRGRLGGGPRAGMTAERARPGERVRVTAKGSWTGVLQPSESDSISVLVDGSGERLSIAWASVDRLEVSAGRKSRWKSVLVGAGVGLAVSSVAGFIFDERGLTNCRLLNPKCDSLSGWDVAKYAGAGMLSGGVVGALVHRGERWRDAVMSAQFGFAIR